MCAKQSLKQPTSEAKDRKVPMPSLVPGNTVRSGYHSWRSSPRGSERSPVRNDAGRNALSGVKVSSPVKQHVPEWPSVYEVSNAVMASAAKATPVHGLSVSGTLGVQVHGMYRRLSQELGRSPRALSLRRASSKQDVKLKCGVMRRREVRGFRSSEEVE
jgi:hypothetical protein